MGGGRLWVSCHRGQEGEARWVLLSLYKLSGLLMVQPCPTHRFTSSNLILEILQNLA